MVEEGGCGCVCVGKRKSGPCDFTYPPTRTHALSGTKEKAHYYSSPLHAPPLVQLWALRVLVVTVKCGLVICFWRVLAL